MHISRKGSRKLLFVGLMGFLISLALIAYAVFQRPDTPLPAVHTSMSLAQKESEQVKPSIGSPVRIKIPKINVNAVLEYVGINADGEMDEPTGSANAAWLNRRPFPGEVGTAVVAGHFGYKNPAVFDDLHKLREGDKLYIEDSKGVSTAFIVHELRTYMPEQDAAEVFSSSDGKSHLNLITCKGTWNQASKSYNTRLVVFADKE